jgi:hypothetical protein
MATIFKHLNKIYQCQSLKKKLKRLKIDESEIEIIKDNIPDEELEKYFVSLNNNEIKEEYEDPNRLYYFINPKTGWSITSINPVCKYDGYEQCTKEALESNWAKSRKI